MADVTSKRDRMADVTSKRDRGQLILVTGLLVAVAMVALVLLLNTAIYTENLASRGTDQSGREAVEYRATVVDGVGGLIDAENDREHDNYGDVEDNVEEGIHTIDNYTARSYAVGGTVVRINLSSSSLSLAQGKLIRQTDSREFQNDSGELDDWTLATQVEDTEVRDFRMTVTPSESNVVDAFNVNLSGSGGSTWQAFVYEDGTNVTVATSTDGGSSTDACSVDGSEATVDFTRGTVDGEPCEGLNWSQGISSDYDIEYRNGENATGTYNLTVNISESDSVDPTNVSDDSTSNVYWVLAVYSATFDVSYETPTLTYRSEVRVAPGEPR